MEPVYILELTETVTVPRYSGAPLSATTLATTSPSTPPADSTKKETTTSTIGRIERRGAARRSYDSLSGNYDWRCQVMMLAKARSYERLRRV